MYQAEQYYRDTGPAYRALCPERSGHMNMGFWPAPSLRAAQEALIRDAISHANARLPGLSSLVDAGSGWGGSRRLFHQALPGASYVGVNLSAEQVRAAEDANTDVPGTRYVCGAIEEYARTTMPPVDAFFSLEAAFHFEDKEGLLHALAQRVRLWVVMEICVEDRAELERRPLIHAALRNAWSLSQYQQMLERAGFWGLEVHELSDRTFDGFRDHLLALDTHGFSESRGILRQFRIAFAQMAEMARQGSVRYLRLSALGPERCAP